MNFLYWPLTNPSSTECQKAKSCGLNSKNRFSEKSELLPFHSQGIFFSNGHLIL
ncbi:hypothetical protein LEP1GSC187_1221 [Leptospira santarosai str. ZUN179]|uniref:Uncharacterized protein n=1 Tax=Leptospira santarosai str. ZUN179 TaxID=1049985 RepID=M6VCI0_9LEPT|nr:hypothetical protein LEP1GSC187_1221 [Leptospira santarosai str. ZUN179]